jgi:flagellar motor switch protein FliM
MASRELLTQEEIDALVKGAGETADEDDSGSIETTAYDLASQDRVVRGRLPTLELINEKFARFFKTSLYNLMRHAVDIGVGGIQIVKYSEYVQGLFVPTSMNVLRIKPMTGVGMCVLDAKLVVRLVDRFFGGDGRQIKFEGREFTPTEQRIIGRLVEAALEDLKQAWKPAMPIEIQVLASEVNPSLVNVVGGDEIMVVNSFQVELDGSGGEIHFVFPYAMLEPHRERLENQGHSKTTEVDRNWLPNLQRRLLQAEVTVNCAIAERSLSLKEVLRLKAGDVIPVDMPDSHLVYANEVPAFYAKLGNSRGNLALEYQEPFVSN